MIFEESHTWVPYDLAQLRDGLHLLLARGRIGGKRLVHEIVIAGQLVQAILAAELVETRHSVLAVANQIEGRDIDLPGRGVEPRQTNVLRELRMIVQGKQAQALPSHA